MSFQTTLQQPPSLVTPDEEHDMTSQQTEPTQQREGAAQHHTPAALHQQEHKQPTALLRTIGCTGGLTRLQPHRTSPRLSGQSATQGGLTRLQPRRISRFSGQQATQGGLTRLQPHRISAHLRTTNNQLPRADSLAGSSSGPLRIFTDRQPRPPSPHRS